MSNAENDDFEGDQSEQSGGSDVDALLEAAGRLHVGFDPAAIGTALKMTPEAIKMGVGLLNGMTAVDAFRASGRTGDPKSNKFRSAASKAARTKAMQRFIATAKEYKAEDRPLTNDEKLKIFGALARTNNPTYQIRAAEAHTELQEKMNARDNEGSGDPADTLAIIEAAFGPLVAALLTTRYGSALPAKAQAIFDSMCPECEALLLDMVPRLSPEDIWPERKQTNGHAVEA